MYSYSHWSNLQVFCIHGQESIYVCGVINRVRGFQAEGLKWHNAHVYKKRAMTHTFEILPFKLESSEQYMYIHPLGDRYDTAMRRSNRD